MIRVSIILGFFIVAATFLATFESAESESSMPKNAETLCQEDQVLVFRISAEKYACIFESSVPKWELRETIQVIESPSVFPQTNSEEIQMPEKEVVSATEKGVFVNAIQYTQQAPVIDPEKEYFVTEIADGIFWLIGSGYQVMFVTTGEGVIVTDAPQPIGEKYLQAISEVTDEPITHMIYSHSHPDHTGAAGQIFPADIQYIAHKDTADILAAENDPDRPIPTITFEDTYTLEVGNRVLELYHIGPYHSEGDIVILAPEQRVAMAVDLFHPDAAPFRGFGVTVNMDEHIKAHDTLVDDFDFDVLISGHEQILGTKDHIKTDKEFVLSVMDNVKQAIQETGQADDDDSDDNNDGVTARCMDLTLNQWQGKLGNLEQHMTENCAAMLDYVANLKETATHQDSISTNTDTLADKQAAKVTGDAIILKGEVWADNWFALYLDENLIIEDSVSITTERSFNSETFTFDVTYPAHLNFIVKDFKENDTGLEYIGTAKQQMGDGGFIAQFTDAQTNEIVAVTDQNMQCTAIHQAPLDKACDSESNPIAGEGICDFISRDEPAGWKDSDFDYDDMWMNAIVHSEDEVSPKDGYDEISWDSDAKIIWTEDLEIDNTILCRLTIDDPSDISKSQQP